MPTTCRATPCCAAGKVRARARARVGSGLGLELGLANPNPNLEELLREVLGHDHLGAPVGEAHLVRVRVRG